MLFCIGETPESGVVTVYNDDDDEAEYQAMADNVRLWISEHPVEVVEMLAQHFDSMADIYPRGQIGRFVRVTATEAHKLHWLLIGSDEVIGKLDLEGEEPHGY